MWSCARPIFASERLTWLRDGEQLSYALPKALPNGCQILHLSPLELLEKLSKFIHMDNGMDPLHFLTGLK